MKRLSFWRTGHSNDQLLSNMIKVERNDSQPIAIIKRIRMILEEAYSPSPRSLKLIFALFAFYTLLSHAGQVISHIVNGSLHSWVIALSPRADSGYQDLIAIHAGIGIIIFALLIFVAESLRDDDSTDKARVLLRESFLFPLAVGEILFFFTYVFGRVNFWNYVPVLVIALLAIFSLYRTISVLLSPYTFSIKRADILKERLKRSIGSAIDERIGNNLFFSFLQTSGIGIEYSPFSDQDESKFHIFRSNELGLIVDIDLKALQEFDNEIDRRERIQGLQTVDEESAVQEFARLGSGTTEGLKISKSIKGFILRKLHDSILEKDRTILVIEKSKISNPDFMAELDRLAQKIFIIRRQDRFDKEIRYELAGIKTQFGVAIREGQIHRIQEYSSVYKNLAQVFEEQLNVASGGFKAVEARIERESIFAGWEQVRWLSTDVDDLLTTAAKSHDLNIISEMDYLPISIAQIGYENNDHYLFQVFIGFVEKLYGYSRLEDDKDLSNYLRDRSWRYTNEFIDFHLIRDIEANDLFDQRAEDLKDFGVYCIRIFQNLLKTAFDELDYESFDLFLSKTVNLFNFFKLGDPAPSAASLAEVLKDPLIVDPERAELSRRLRSRILRESVESQLDEMKAQMLFGLASWILDVYFLNQEGEVLRRFFLRILEPLPDRIVPLTELFLSAHTFEVEDFWGWNQWEPRIENAVTTIRILEKLEKLFAVKGLANLNRESPTGPSRPRIPHSRELAYLAEGTRELMDFLKDIEQNPTNWSGIVGENDFINVNFLRSLILEAKSDQESEELRKKIEQPISAVKVEEFKIDFRTGFKESVVLRTIFIESSLFEIREIDPDDANRNWLGINTFHDKGPFLEESHVHYHDYGRHFGRNFARGEDSKLFRDLFGNASETDDLDRVLSSIPILEGAVIIACNPRAARFMRGSARFTPKWMVTDERVELNGWEGYYEINGNKIPVFQIYNSALEHAILVATKGGLGSLVQFTEADNFKRPNLEYDPFEMEIVPFSDVDERLTELLDSPPDWLLAVGDEVAQSNYLRSRVRIKIYEHVAVELALESLYKMILSESAEDDEV